MDEDNSLTYRIIGCGIEVHRHLGPGLSEANYEEALCIELADAGLSYVRQVGVPVMYKGQQIGEHRPDLVVENGVVVEIKSVEHFIGVHRAQVLTYMRILKVPLGLLLNFNSEALRTGIERLRILLRTLPYGLYLCASEPLCVVDTRRRCRLLPGDLR